MCLELKDCFFRWDGPYDETSATDKGIYVYIHICLYKYTYIHAHLKKT